MKHQKRIKLEINKSGAFYVKADGALLLCRRGLGRWFYLPYETAEIDLVLSTKPMKEGYQCKLGGNDGDLDIQVRDGDWCHDVIFSELDEYIALFLRERGRSLKSRFWLAINRYYYR